MTSVDDGGELHAGELESITDSLDMIASISETDVLVTEEQSQVGVQYVLLICQIVVLSIYVILHCVYSVQDSVTIAS